MVTTGKISQNSRSTFLSANTNKWNVSSALKTNIENLSILERFLSESNAVGCNRSVDTDLHWGVVSPEVHHWRYDPSYSSPHRTLRSRQGWGAENLEQHNNTLWSEHDTFVDHEKKYQKTTTFSPDGFSDTIFLCLSVEARTLRLASLDIDTPIPQ